MAFYLDVSEAQYRAFEQVTERGSDRVVRFRDGNVRTLIAMERRKWVTLTWGTVDGKRGIVHAELLPTGRKVYADTKATRERQAARANIPTRIATADPFALIATSNRREHDIPF